METQTQQTGTQLVRTEDYQKGLELVVTPNTTYGLDTTRQEYSIEKSAKNQITNHYDEGLQKKLAEQTKRINGLEDAVAFEEGIIAPSKFLMGASILGGLASLALPALTSYVVVTHYDVESPMLMLIPLSILTSLSLGIPSLVGLGKSVLEYTQHLPELHYKQSQLKRAKKELERLRNEETN